MRGKSRKQSIQAATPNFQDPRAVEKHHWHFNSVVWLQVESSWSSSIFRKTYCRHQHFIVQNEGKGITLHVRVYVVK